VKRVAVACLQLFGALSLCGIALYVAHKGVDFKWIAISAETLVLFGLVCYQSKDLWTNPRYWAIFGAALILHLVGAVLVQRNRPIFPGLYYGLIITFEAILLRGLIVILFS
jgi:hypothetical protein